MGLLCYDYCTNINLSDRYGSPFYKYVNSTIIQNSRNHIKCFIQKDTRNIYTT